ncbi:uncharacterized protein LOC126668609 [Mercurialis annua]|uniref:uncharacterized protein LOC126668609 n=1 Tax=Mercurialis annua TaxID=3986 RepID=UPI00215E6E28|nr:uncharacterized protein LOC126668609 [Mercurialis annua]
MLIFSAKMASFSGLGIGLSLVFGCLLLAFVAEIYYLLWWKKRVTITTTRELIEDEDNYSFFHLICWRKPNSIGDNSSQERLRDQSINRQEHEQDLELGAAKDLLIKAFSTENQESVEAELMRLHNLAGPPRFLFTINEETKEDLESDDGRSRKGSRTKSLSDILLTVDTTPFLTPLASPRLNPSLLDCYHNQGFNPLFESSSLSVEAEINRLRSSPPPKFKFLRDAEEKLFRKLMEESEKKTVTEEITVTEGSFLGFIVGKNKERISSSAQVLPLASSPSTTFRQVDKNLNVL